MSLEISKYTHTPSEVPILSNSIFGSSFPSTIQTVYYDWQDKKGGHGESGGGGGGGGGHGETGGGHGETGGSGKGDGDGSESGSGKGDGDGSESGSGSGSGSYHYNGINYQYGYPVRYWGNAWYPAGIIIPVAYAGADGMLLPGREYYTYVSSDTLYYSQIPTACGASNSANTSTGSSAVQTCISSGSSLSFSTGGIVTIQQDELASVAYSTLSYSSSTSQVSTTSEISTSASSISTITTSSSKAIGNNVEVPIVKYTGRNNKLTSFFVLVVGLGTAVSLM